MHSTPRTSGGLSKHPRFIKSNNSHELFLNDKGSDQGASQKLAKLVHTNDSGQIVSRHSQVDCLRKCMNTAIKQIRLALIFSKLLENSYELETVLNGTKYEHALELIDKFIRRQSTRATYGEPPIMDQQLVTLLDYLHQNADIYDILPDWKNELEEYESQIILMFTMLNDVVWPHFKRTPEDVFKDERDLHVLYEKTLSISKANREFVAQMHSERYRAMWKTFFKFAPLQNHENRVLHAIHDQNQSVLEEKKIVIDDLRVNRRAHHEALRDLQEKYENSEQMYNKAIQGSLNNEREVRAEKNKFQLQLKSLITKYDQVIGEKMRELIDLQTELAVANQKLVDYMPTFKREELVYKEIVVKHEEELREEQLRRVNIFRMNRAARIIQKYVRKWLRHLRKKLKEFLKSKQKGKK